MQPFPTPIPAPLKGPAARSLALVLVLPVLLGICSCGHSAEDKKALGFYLENAYRYYNLGEYERCVHQADRGLEVDPGNEQFSLVKARALLLVGTTESLETSWHVLQELKNIDNFQVEVTLGGVQERRGIVRRDSAREIASGQRFTEHPDPAARAVELEADAASMWKDALQHYSAAERLFPGGTEALNGLMRTATLLGDDQKALEAGRALILSLHESNRVLEKKIADLRNEAREPRKEFQAIVANEQVLTATHIHLAELHHGKGRLPAALEELEAAAAIDGKQPAVHGRLAQLLAELGRTTEAVAEIDRFLALSDQPFDHPDVVRARELRRACEERLREAKRREETGS